jgi:hypothetical protein
MTCEGRTYFFNVKQNRMGDVFLTIVESKPTEAETFDRRSIVVFREDMHGFLNAFKGALKFMEKPGSAPETMAFNPEEEAPRPAPRKAPKATGATATGEKKRRVVVKRKDGPAAAKPADADKPED